MTRRSNALAAILVFALSLIALVGCSRGDSPLDGTHWKLSNWTLSSLRPADFTITTFSTRSIPPTPRRAERTSAAKVPIPQARGG